MEKNINEYFDKSDLKEVKDLLKSLDLKVETREDEPEVSHQAFYNTFSRPDKEEESPEERQKILQKTLIDFLKEDQRITLFWDISDDSTLIQILVDGQDWSNPPIKNVEALLINELKNTLHFPQGTGGYTTGDGQFYLDANKELVLKYATEEEYWVSEQLEDADLWSKTDLPEYIVINRFFENSLSSTLPFGVIRRGFNAEISVQEKKTKADFYFAPSLKLSTASERELTKLLLEKIDKIALERYKFDFSRTKYLPNFSLNGQISAEKVAVLNLEASYIIFEKQEGQAILFGGLE